MRKFSLLLINNRSLFMAIWIVIILFACLNLLFNKNTFESGIGSIDNSISKEVEIELQKNFKQNLSANLIITFYSNLYNFEDDIFIENIKNLENTLKNEIYIKAVLSPLNTPLPDMFSKDKKTAVLLVQLVNEDFSFAEKKVSEIRDILTNFSEENSVELFLTGNAAFSYDMNLLSEQQGKEAEKRIFIITLIVLIFAFRSLSAAFIAVMAGFIASTITIALLNIITFYYPLSVFSQSISTMLGLALGIDYSLLLITRFRKELLKNSRKEAIQITILTSGKAIIFSGFSVLIGLSALFISGLRLSNSIATGGIIVVFFSILTALTFTPVLIYSAEKILDYPKFLSGIVLKNRMELNTKWISFIVKNSWFSFAISVLFLLLLSYPLLNLKLSEPDVRTMPDSMETKQGFMRLLDISESELMSPVHLLVKAEKGLITDTVNFEKLNKLVSELRQERLINKVYSYAEVYSLSLYFPFADISPYKNFFISKDDTTSLIMIFPSKKIENHELNQLISKLRYLSYNGLIVRTGGAATLSYDLIEKLYDRFPMIISLVFLATFILLAIAFKSLVIPVKAIFANTLSILASYGILVIIFQYGWFAGLINLQYVPGSVLSGIPVLLFCIMFSLSMDYEVFLLSRVQEVYLETGDNTKAIITGISEIGEVITKAAMVMLIVFGAFVQADIIMIKMLGVGLFSAVLIDATVVRLVLVPSFMKLAGKANWYMPLAYNKVKSKKQSC